jgi:hypothetical protein
MVTKGFAEERQRGDVVLFPVRIDDAVLTTNKAWAVKLRDNRHIGDFCRWNGSRRLPEDPRPAAARPAGREPDVLSGPMGGTERSMREWGKGQFGNERFPSPVTLQQHHEADVAAVLTAIKRRSEPSRERERASGWLLDLNGAVLKRAILPEAHLEGA